ncbi:MAG TPA: hypothetical protein VKB96_07640, partial [Gammaproteobacteria bacterium]|nr:hypothetical protein [Gammaproteobacteria bacterium]
MSADGLIQEIRRHGANVSVEDGELYLDGALPLPTSLMEQLRLRKGALLDYLSATAPVRELAPSVTAPSAPNC